MQWLNKIADEAIAHHPKGEIIIESGSSPSGTYHLGHLRELITCDAILIELKKRGRKARHIAYVDDLDALRKIPVNIPSEYEKYLGRSLCDVPSPNDPKRSYADFFLQGLIDSCGGLGIDVEFMLTHKKYRQGFFTQAIEHAMENTDIIRKTLETISGHKLGQEWSPVQINEDGYLKKRQFLSIDKTAKIIFYKDKEGKEQSISYLSGDVKLDWRIDWPARWWLLDVAVEPFGRDHATKGGSYDTGAAIVKEVFGAQPPQAVAYDFVNLAGDTKKMSASKGTGLDALGSVKVLPPEIVRFFMLRYPPSKRLYFDPVNGISQLIDEFAALVAKKDKTDGEKQLVDISMAGVSSVVSCVPFSHLVASYQSALKNPQKTLDALTRTEYREAVDEEKEVIQAELAFIDRWLEKWAPEEIKFELIESINKDDFNQKEKDYLSKLSTKIVQSPSDADGEWFHKAIYEVATQVNISPKEVFPALYKAIIGKTSGPRAGWFLSILPREWLIKRLNLEA